MVQNERKFFRQMYVCLREAMWSCGMEMSEWKEKEKEKREKEWKMGERREREEVVVGSDQNQIR